MTRATFTLKQDGFAHYMLLLTVIVIAGIALIGYHVYQTELYPTSVRSSAIGIAYSLSRAVSAILPFIAVALLDRIHAAGIFTASAVLIALLCLDVALLGPRTNGVALDERLSPVSA